MKRKTKSSNSGKITEVHFIGIGGMGVSALAKYYLHSGAKVGGSDLVSSEITDDLEKRGARILIGPHKKTNFSEGRPLVIYTSAVPQKNSELQEARRRKLKIKSYPEAVGELTKNYKTIAVSGSHGKTTTSALIGLVLEEGYLNPTVIVGAKVKEFGDSNFRPGKGSYLVLEADEWNKSFFNYHPQIIAVTNVDAEHLDTYKTAAGVERAFEKYLRKVPAGGFIVANYDDPRLRKIAQKFGKKVIWYSRQDKETDTIRRTLKIPGEHNVSNALAAFRVGQILGIREQDILRAFSRFSGAWRRFELKGTVNGAFVFADYGHHPTEVKATIAAARERFPFRRVWCVYQPHLYQRLAYMWDGFISAFDLADKVCLLPVYDVAGREGRKEHAKFNSLKLAKEISKRGKNVNYLETFEKAKKFIQSEARPSDILLVMGAGDIYDLTGELTPPLKNTGDLQP